MYRHLLNLLRNLCLEVRMLLELASFLQYRRLLQALSRTIGRIELTYRKHMYLYHQLLYLFVTNRVATSILLIVTYKSRLYHHHIFRLRCSPFRRACVYIIVVEPSLKELGCGLSLWEFPAIRGVYFTSFQSEATIFFNFVERLM